MGIPNLEKTNTVVAVENSAAKPLVGVISVIFLPIVSAGIIAYIIFLGKGVAIAILLLVTLALLIRNYLWHL